jgi:hypothetical protein
MKSYYGSNRQQATGRKLVKPLRTYSSQPLLWLDENAKHCDLCMQSAFLFSGVEVLLDVAQPHHRFRGGLDHFLKINKCKEYRRLPQKESNKKTKSNPFKRGFCEGSEGRVG